MWLIVKVKKFNHARVNGGSNYDSTVCRDVRIHERVNINGITLCTQGLVLVDLGFLKSRTGWRVDSWILRAVWCVAWIGTELIRIFAIGMFGSSRPRVCFQSAESTWSYPLFELPLWRWTSPAIGHRDYNNGVNGTRSISEGQCVFQTH